MRSHPVLGLRGNTEGPSRDFSRLCFKPLKDDQGRAFDQSSNPSKQNEREIYQLNLTRIGAIRRSWSAGIFGGPTKNRPRLHIRVPVDLGIFRDDFDDDSLSKNYHHWLDELTAHRTDLQPRMATISDCANGELVSDGWVFIWMILAEKRGLLNARTTSCGLEETR
jgi:hypothetical protein